MNKRLALLKIANPRLAEGIDKVEVFLNRRLLRKTQDGRPDRRPVEIVILHAAKATKLTYKRVRLILDKMTQAGAIERYPAWKGLNVRVNRYRWPKDIV